MIIVIIAVNIYIFPIYKQLSKHVSYGTGNISHKLGISRENKGGEYLRPLLFLQTLY